MNVVELGSRLSWWRGALWGVVLAVAAGVLGMHVLTAGHSAHDVDAGAHVTQQEASDPGVVAAHAVTTGGDPVLTDHASHSHIGPGDHAASIDMSFSLATSSLGSVAPGDSGPAAASHAGASIPACDTDCGRGMGSVCLAVVLLVLLRLRHRAWNRGQVQAAHVSLVTLVPALGVGPARPSLVQLCVSRT